MFFGYDPVQDLPGNHLAWLVERVVEEALQHPALPLKKGQPAFDPRLCAKVLLYGYATGIRSSRQLERHCRENLPFLLLTRGDTPSYRTLCYFRVDHPKLIEEVWVSLFGVAEQLGMQRLGRIVVDSSKFRADASAESVIKAEEYSVFRQQLQLILQEAQDIDASEDQNPPGATTLDTEVKPDQMREIIRAIRKRIAAEKNNAPTSAEDEIAPLPSAALGPRMLPRIKAALDTLEQAEQEGLKHACLTDPDARMMGEGRDKPIKECHSFEVAVDVDAALLVAAGVTQQSDNSRLEPLYEAAQEQEPCAIVSVDADSGYYKGEGIARLQEQGIDTCVPDANGYNTGNALAINFYEWCQDHNKPMQAAPFGDVAGGGPVTLPEPTLFTNGAWYGGSPYLGPDATVRATGPTGTTPPSGTIANSPTGEAGFAFMWHSHNEREITTNNIFPGGMLMMMLVDSREFVIDESN